MYGNINKVKQCYNAYMISLNHVLAGTAIGLAVKQPTLAASLAFLSHFVLDAFPHWNYGDEPGTKLWWKVWIVDAIGSFIALLLLCLSAPELAWAIILGGTFAELPDVFWIYYLNAGRPKWLFFRFHKWIQWSETSRGFYYELGYLVIFVVINIALL
jgi:hypothetical protein